MRELRSTMQRALVLGQHARVVGLRELERAVASGLNRERWPHPDDEAAQQDGLKRELLATARDVGADTAVLAEALGISRATLFRRLTACGLSVRELRRVLQLTR